MPAPTIPAVLDRHAEEAAVLWLQRHHAVNGPHYTLRTLAELDERLEAHLDGLRIAGPAGRERAWQEFVEHPEPGETFVAGVLAFEAADPGRIAPLLAAAAAQPELVRPLVSAVGWLSEADAALAVPLLLSWNDATGVRVGIGGAAVRREHPGAKAMMRALQHQDAAVRGRAFRAVGELGDRALIPELYIGQADADADGRYWANWSVALMTADPSAVATVREDYGARERHALNTVARLGEPRLFRAWLRARMKGPDLRTAILAAGAFGEADQVPWLIDRTAEPATARLAAEAITAITGLDFTDAPFEGDAPPDHESGPTDDADDEDVAPDPDADLPWPNPNALRDWWARQRSRFPTEMRLLLGRPVTADWLRQVLAGGGQRHRAAAALELAARHPGQPLIETRAPGWKQGRGGPG